TSVSGIESTSTPNSIDPSTDGSTMWPALRITKRSPRPWSKTTSAGTRESEQPNTSANGFWWPASSARRWGSWCSCRLLPATSRWLPSGSRVSAESGVAGLSIPTVVLLPGVSARSEARVDQGERLDAVSVQGESGLRVRAGPATVHHGHRRPGGHRPPHEPVPGPDGEGRSHDDDEVGGVHERVRLGDARGRDVLA